MTPFIATDKRIKYIFSSPGNRRKKKKSAGLIGDCFTLGVLEKVWMIETKEKHKRNNWTAMETVAFCWPLMEEKKRETCGQLCSD